MVHIYRQISVLSSDSAASDFTPVSGMEEFLPNLALTEFTVQSVDDNIPEPSKMFTMNLVAVSFRASIDSTGDTAMLTGEYVRVAA